MTIFLSYVQIKDTLYIAHPEIQPHRIRVREDGTFEVVPVTIDDMPVLPLELNTGGQPVSWRDKT